MATYRTSSATPPRRTATSSSTPPSPPRARSVHAYVDAQRRKHPFTLLVTESSGAFSSTLTRALRAIGTQARLKSSTDYWPLHRLLVILGKCLCHMFQMARQMSRRDMTCLATEPWQMSRHVAMFRHQGENFRSARCARRLRVCFWEKYRRNGENQC